MKSIKRRFDNLKEKCPEISSYTNFARAIKGQKFSKKMLHYWFHILVNKEDYKKNEKKSILFHLDNLSNMLRKDKIEG